MRLEVVISPYRSPAAADGNELNMSGCLGAGASLQRVLSAWITSNMADAREVWMLQCFLGSYSPLGVICQ